MIIDAHTHLPADHPRAVALLEELGVKALNISIGLDSGGLWRQSVEFGAHGFEQLTREHGARFAWCTSFDAPRFDDPAYAERCIALLARDFAAGAVACKVWKNLGMGVRDPQGKFVLVDHPLLDPIYEYLTREQRTLIAHVGEPRACWRPLEEDSPHADYYREHPEWHCYGKNDTPSWQELIDARDRLLTKHPKLRVVGAHLGSMEHDVGEVARRLERFANFAVDTAARTLDLALQDADLVRDLFRKFGERLLFGSDLLLERRLSEMSGAELDNALEAIRATYRRELDYYGSLRTFEWRRWQVTGLGLAQPALDRLLTTNARTWFGAL